MEDLDRAIATQEDTGDIDMEGMAQEAALWQVYDPDQDGPLGNTECSRMPTFLAGSGGVREALPKEFLREMYHGVDLDGDQAVSRSEFTKAFATTWSEAWTHRMRAGAGAERWEL